MGKFGFIVAACAALVATRPASACGGGGVTTTRGTVANAQRILISVRGRVTDVVAQINVPETNADYGVLIPVPAEPVIDPEPFPAAELELLDDETAPLLRHGSGESDGFSCGCGAAGDSKASGTDRGVSVSEPVDVGPVTAVVLEAGSGQSLTDWLETNGFELPSESQPLVDEYVAAGNRFIAIRRNSTLTTGAPSSIGLHYTLPGDHRKLSLRFAQLGAAEEVTFTVFIAAHQTVAPSEPFEVLTLEDLGRGVVDYAAALRAAVKARGGRAFVLESSTPFSTLGFGESALKKLLDPGVTITRASTIMKSADLDADTSFVVSHPDVGRYLSSRDVPVGAVSVTSLGLLAALRSFRKRRSSAAAHAVR